MTNEARRVVALRFSVFELHLERRELRRRGRPVPLPPQALQVLEHLLASGGRVVPRDELCRSLWPGPSGLDQERALNYCVSRVRRALGDAAQTPRFVETLPRRGYRFLAEVDAVQDARPASAPPPSRTRAWGASLARGLRPLLIAAAALACALQGAPRSTRSEPGRPGLPSRVPAAQAAFDEGRRLLDEGPAGWRLSVARFEEAARLDPGFALARYGLADAYMRLGEHGVIAPEAAFPPARRAALEALAIEDRAEPLVILAALELNYDWDWEGAERALRRAIALDPDLADARLGYARLLSAAGRHAEAIREVREAESRWPGCPNVARDVALVYYRAHRFGEAARGFRAWAALEPKQRDPHHWLALLYHVSGRPLEAVREARLVYTMAAAAPEYVRRFDALPPAEAMAFYIRGSIGYLERVSGSQWVGSDDFARLRAHLGESDGALRDLGRAADERSPRLLSQLRDPAFDPLRSDPRFIALVARVRAPQPRAASAG